MLGFRVIGFGGLVFKASYWQREAESALEFSTYEVSGCHDLSHSARGFCSTLLCRNSKRLIPLTLYFRSWQDDDDDHVAEATNESVPLLECVGMKYVGMGCWLPCD